MKPAHIIAVAVITVSLISIALGADRNDRANCTRYGVPAVCHDPAVVKAAGVLAARRCPRKTSDHAGWAVSLDRLEGPYGDPRRLAADICLVAY